MKKEFVQLRHILYESPQNQLVNELDGVGGADL